MTIGAVGRSLACPVVGSTMTPRGRGKPTVSVRRRHVS